MPAKRDMDATTGKKLLRLFLRLMLDDRKHYLSELANWLNCSSQTIIRLAGEIEDVIGVSLMTGKEKHRRWYRIIPRASHRQPEMDFDELRYLLLCREQAAAFGPVSICQRIDENIFKLSMLLSEAPSPGQNRPGASPFAFFAKGRIDYVPFFSIIETLLEAKNSRLICLVRYKEAGSGTCRMRHFAVGNLIYMDNALYARGAEVEDDFSTMRQPGNIAIHRIQSAELTAYPVNFMLPEDDHGILGLPWPDPRVFHVHFTAGLAADYVRERIWAETQRIEELPDGGIILHIITRNHPELTAWVLGFGGAASMLEDNDNGKA